MRFWSSGHGAEEPTTASSQLPSSASNLTSSSSSSSSSNDDGSPQQLLSAFTSSQTLVPALILTSATLLVIRTYKRHLRRVPGEAHLHPTRHLASQHTTSDLSTAKDKLRSTTSLFGRVTSVGDADNFRIYHTPGGRLAGFHWLRRVPSTPKTLRNETLHIRIAGIDAPELAHFGRPAQPHSAEALAWLKKQVEGRDVRVWLHRRDQYGRVVGSAFVRRAGIVGLPRSWMRDIGHEMIRAGWATVYEAKFGAEFGGKEAEYRAAEAAAKREKIGMWGGNQSARNAGWGTRVLEMIGLRTRPEDTEAFESPRQYKTRMKELGAGAKTGATISPSKPTNSETASRKG
ncbi:hypothetical protein FH972_026374 [Carpinus fangiana]|uniref:Probable endonuclease LCL3 n=1 Tax=Carpinus fangiana TaxID=176857 RepID=A0A5N6L3T9_9ROSI|nr:hypothetical protein FH972_026374 [Carpinus fangiana]